MKLGWREKRRNIQPEEIISAIGAIMDKLKEYAKPSPNHCQARNVGGRVCGAPLKEGINGHLSCSDMSCQVPATGFKKEMMRNHLKNKHKV